MPDSGLSLWYPRAVRDPAPPSCWGAHADDGEPKFLLHTTEGPAGVYAPDPRQGDGRRYYGNTGTWPHYTLAREVGLGPWRVYQHIPADRSAMSLRNRPGGVQTNRDNVSQIEIAWKAAEIRSLPAEAMEELARLLAWEHAVRGVPLVSTVRWVAHPASYGEHAAQRLSGPAWDAYAGILGHQHAAENSHGDPGDFPIEALLTRARSIAAQTTPPPEDSMADGLTSGDLRAALDEHDKRVHEQAFWVGPGEDPVRQGNVPRVWAATYRKAGHLEAMVAELAAELDDVKRGLVAVAPDAAAVMERAPEPAAPAPLSRDRVREYLAGATDLAELAGLVATGSERMVHLTAAAGRASDAA